jgi:hypothetical protein
MEGVKPVARSNPARWDSTIGRKAAETRDVWKTESKEPKLEEKGEGRGLEKGEEGLVGKLEAGDEARV